MTSHYDALIPAPFGAVAISAHGMRISVELFSAPPENIEQNTTSENKMVQRVQEELSRYLDHSTHYINLPVRAHGTPFQQRVWQAISAVPRGQTITYGELAKTLDSSARAVANACGANPLPLIIPCHRVVAKTGLGGFNRSRSPESLAIKQWLLDHERAQ